MANLLEAAKFNTLEVLKKIIDEGNIDINQKDNKGYPAIFYAIFHDNMDMLKELINAGVDINIKFNMGKLKNLTPLSSAVLKGCSTEIIKTLVDAGAEINSTDIYECTPLHYAAMKQNEPLVQELINAGANVNARNIYDRTPIFNVDDKDSEIAKILINAGAE
jgi:ankyrin repeat protein